MAASLLQVGLSGAAAAGNRIDAQFRRINMVRCSAGAAASTSAAEESLRSKQGQGEVVEMLKNSSGKTWWAPLFGFSAQDSQEWSRDAGDKSQELAVEEEDDRARVEDRKETTAAKFRLLRKKLKGMDTYHDTMYHSSIASRLAMD